MRLLSRKQTDTFLCGMNYNNNGGKKCCAHDKILRQKTNGLESNSKIYMSRKEMEKKQHRNKIEDEIPYSGGCGECDRSTS